MGGVMNEGFIKLRRGHATLTLLRDLKAMGLLMLIALRAKRTDDLNIHGLEIGQALVGDHEACGLTKQEYRSAKVRLRRYGLADFKATPRGTTAILLDQRIYDINAADGQHASSTQPAPSPQTPNTAPTTNKNAKNGKNERNLAPSAEAERLASLLFDLIRQRKADYRQPNLSRWARDIDRLVRLDRRQPEQVETVMRWCQSDSFWQNNILSPAALRRQFDRLELQMQQRPRRESTREMVARMEREGKLG